MDPENFARNLIESYRVNFFNFILSLIAEIFVVFFLFHAVSEKTLRCIFELGSFFLNWNIRMYILQRILIGSVFSNFIIIFNVEILFSISQCRENAIANVLLN